MKKVSLILNVLLVAIVLVFAFKLCANSDSKAVSASSGAVSKDAMEVIMTRTSVREYTDQVVEKEKVDQILQAAMASPTGSNRQPWAFVVVDDREVLDELADATSRILNRTGLGIVVCGDLSKMHEEGHPSRDYWIQDCSAASENALLAAHALDLGAVWIGVYLQDAKVKAVQEILSLPSNIVPLNILSVGYPTGPTEPKDKWNTENIHYNVW